MLMGRTLTELEADLNLRGAAEPTNELRTTFFVAVC